MPRLEKLRRDRQCDKRLSMLEHSGALNGYSLFSEILRLGHDEDYNPKYEPKPTEARAGSTEKIQVLAARVIRGEWLFHPEDNPMSCTIAESNEARDYFCTRRRRTK